MHPTLPPVPIPIAVPGTRALIWFAQGLRLWRQAPIALTLLSLAPLAVEFPMQLIPVVGVVLSKLVVPIVQAGLWVGLDEMTRGRPLRAACLGAGFARGRLGALAGLSGYFLLIPATQLLVVTAIYGSGALDRVLLGHVHPGLGGPAFILALILPGVLPGTLLMLSMPLVLFNRLGPTGAVVLSARLVGAAPGAFALFTLVTTVLMGVALLGRGLPLLVVAPLLFTATYAAHRDLQTR